MAALPQRGLSVKVALLFWSWEPWRCQVCRDTDCLSLRSYGPRFSCSVVSDSLWPHGLQHARPPCPLSTAGVCSNSCPLSRSHHPAISSSVVPFSSCLQSFPASGSFPRSQFFASRGQSVGVSASAPVLPMNIQDWSPLGWTGWIFRESKGLSESFSSLWRLAIGGPLWLILLGCSARQALRQPPCLGPRLLRVSGTYRGPADWGPPLVVCA